MTTPDPVSTPPIAIPGLEFVRPVGIGGTSVVWLARQTSLERDIAVKILDAGRLADPVERERFRTEARAAARLASPAIVQILDFGEIDGRLYYTMEYVSGGSLADWLRDNPQMQPSAVWKLVRTVAATLDAAWNAVGIVHGDIKPGNLLVAADGGVKLADLGLASLADAHSGGPSDAVVEGTPTYFAPEQLEGTPPSCQSDMYALGLSAYHLLTGRPPFEGLPTPDDVLEAQRSDYLPDPVPLSLGLTDSGAWLLQKLTAKTPSLRPATWAQVVADIDRVLADLPPSPPYPDPADSTILLDASRSPTALDAARPRLANGRRIIRVASASAGASPSPSSAPSSSARRPARKSSSGGGFVKFLLFLLFLAGILAAIWFFFLRGHPEYFEQLSGKTPAPAGRPELPVRPAEPAETDAGASAVQAPAESASHPVADNGAWTHPDYVALAGRFNEALARYRTAAGLAVDFTRPADAHPADYDDPVWSQIAAEAAAVAAGFDALLPEAPPSVPLRDYANQAWQLVNDATLMSRSRAQKIDDFHRAPKHRHAALAPWPAPKPSDPASPFATLHYQLGYAWDVLPAPVGPLSSELLVMLAGQAVASPSTRTFPGQKLLGPFTAMMPVADAAKALGAPLPARTAVRGGVFPDGGVFRYDFDAGRWGSIRRPLPAYPRLSLLADADDNLLALYFSDPAPTALAHPDAAFSPTTRAGDFVEGTVLPEDSSSRAVNSLLIGGPLCRIDSEIADFSSEPPAPVRQSTLIFPSDFANAVLYHLLGRSESGGAE